MADRPSWRRPVGKARAGLEQWSFCVPTSCRLYHRVPRSTPALAPRNVAAALSRVGLPYEWGAGITGSRELARPGPGTAVRFSARGRGFGSAGVGRVSPPPRAAVQSAPVKVLRTRVNPRTRVKLRPDLDRRFTIVRRFTTASPPAFALLAPPAPAGTRLSRAAGTLRPPPAPRRHPRPPPAPSGPRRHPAAPRRHPPAPSGPRRHPPAPSGLRSPRPADQSAPRSPPQRPAPCKKRSGGGGPGRATPAHQPLATGVHLTVVLGSPGFARTARRSKSSEHFDLTAADTADSLRSRPKRSF